MKTKHEQNEQPVARLLHKRITDIIKERGWKRLPARLRQDRIPTVSSENTRDQIGPCKRPDLCMLDEGHIPCPVCPNDPSIAPSLACSAFERAAQICRYYLKHQNHPSRWDDKSDYEQGVQIACDNLAALMLEEAGKFKAEAGSSLEELAANWERAGFRNVAAAIRNSRQNKKR